MNKSDIFLIIIIAINLVTNLYQKYLISSYKVRVEAYERELSSKYYHNKSMLRYCLSDIIDRAIKREDYETAQECKQMLDAIEQDN